MQRNEGEPEDIVVVDTEGNDLEVLSIVEGVIEVEFTRADQGEGDSDPYT